MSAHLNPLTRAAADPVAGYVPITRRDKATAASVNPDVKLDLGATASTPPDEALAAVDRAHQVVEQLHAQGRELHFETGHPSGRIVVQVRDMDGNVLREIPPSEALDLLSGGEE